MLAVAAALPATALANTVTASILVPPGDVSAGSTVQVSCRAEGDPPGMFGGGTGIDQVAVTVTGGTVTPALFTTKSTAPCTGFPTKTCNVIQGTAAWVTPSAPGSLTATCSATFAPLYSPKVTVSGSASLTTVAALVLPPAIAGVNGPTEVATGSSNVFEAVATDPNTPPKSLTYAWSATGGTVTPDATNPARVAWDAPATTGAHKLTVTVSNGTASSSANKDVNVVIATYQSTLPQPLGAPRRLASDGATGIFVVDGNLNPPAGATGTVALATVRGEARGFATLPEPALAVATGAGSLWVTTTKGSVYRVDPVTGRNLGKLALASGAFARPSGIAYDPVHMTLWVADQDAYRVRVIRPDGTTVAVIGDAAGVPFQYGRNPADPTDTSGDPTPPVDVAVDAANGKAWVLLQRAMDSSSSTAVKNCLLHQFDLVTAAYLGSSLPSGGGLGQATTGGGVAVGPAGIYVSDAFQGAIQVVSPAGAAVATIGAWGTARGQLSNPTGLAVMANGDIAVANFSAGKIERFGSGALLPTCAGDADCDLLPDAWELANGLDPNWAGDGLLDPDRDGLNNAQELAAGTNPYLADTDGDGFSDGAELASGFDPLNPNDHIAVVKPSFPTETPPGLVKLAAVVSGPGTCSAGWSQKAGPAVSLSGADTLNASFIARAAGSYAFDVVGKCGALTSAPVRATVVVKNVAPLADAGPVVVAAPGSLIRLDALGSSDANGDALAFTWDQTLGRPLVGTQTGGALTARPRGVGLYAFQVAVSDPAGAASTVEVPVLVAEGQAPTAIVALPALDARVGTPVALDATMSLAPDGAAFSWRQVAGPAVALTGANGAVASFVPPSPGRYAFDVTVGTGGLGSPPARVEVFVSVDGTLPVVSAAVPSVVSVGSPVSLDATATPSSASVTWRQVSGPAAGLTNAADAVATVVPFAAGFHVFEAAVKDGTTEGHPTRVAFEARAGGAAIPQARIQTPPGDAWTGQLVFLDGRGSAGATRYRWSQVAGPWVAFGTQGSVATFRPLSVGLYAFELVVDDGVTRSAPARVEVNVVAGEVK